MSILLSLLGLGSIGGAIWFFGPTAILAWLKHASFWQIVAIALAAFALLQHFQLAGEKRHSQKLEKQLHAATETLDRLSKESAEKQKQTERVITKYVSVDAPDADRRARKVENAPLSGQCHGVTPSEVLQADL